MRRRGAPTPLPPAPAADGAGNVVGTTTPGTIGPLWFQALTVFETVATVNGLPSGAAIQGLGPSFNGQSCFECHSQPTVGGSSPGHVSTAHFSFTSNGFTENPQIQDASAMSANNSVPTFLDPDRSNGPIIESRVINAVPAVNFAAAVPAGAVAELFVIDKRTDAPGACVIDQVDLQTQFGNNNLIFRIPIPTFGDGFVENIPESALAQNFGANATLKSSLGINSNAATGFNRGGNDGTITRFGWKAQNKSLLMFAGEAANVELGVTNELFPNEKSLGNGHCATNAQPEDQVTAPALDTALGAAGEASVISSDIENFAVFMRLNGAPSICNWNSGLTNGFANCLAVDQTVLAGAALFGSTILPAPSGTAPASIGCVLCHSDNFTTAASVTGSLSNAPVHPFSDFGLHHMGGLADGVTQGLAGPDQFRTAPLWGLGQRLFFMHDGRASDLAAAIADHCLTPTGSNPASEACKVVANFHALSAAQQEDIFHFLRSL